MTLPFLAARPSSRGGANANPHAGRPPEGARTHTATAQPGTNATIADLSEFHLCILMQQPVSPFAISEAEEVSGLALTLAFWVGSLPTRCVVRVGSTA